MAPLARLDARRLIVAFGAPGSDPMRRWQALVAEARCRLVDRDTDVILVDPADLVPFDSAGAAVIESPALARALAAHEGRVGDAPTFELVLIGRDGGIKARETAPEALDALLARIDGMPMRRAEMRRRGGADVGCD